MLRFFAGVAACFLLMTGAFLIWQSRAAQAPNLPDAPQARTFSASMLSAGSPLRAPEATPQSREERRFSRADKNKDGRIETVEYFAARRRFFDKLDVDHNGSLTFPEYAAKAIAKYQGADRDHTGWLTPAEFAATAPPPPKHKTCSCGRPEPAQVADNSDD